MSSEEGSIGGSNVSDEEYDRRAEILYRNMKEVSANCGKYIVWDSYILKQVFRFSALTSWDIPRSNFLDLFHLDVYYEDLINGIKNWAC